MGATLANDSATEMGRVRPGTEWKGETGRRPRVVSRWHRLGHGPRLGLDEGVKDHLGLLHM